MKLCIRADQPDVYCGLWSTNSEITSKNWQAGRELSQQLLNVIEDLCQKAGKKIEDIEGLVVYEGSGSYTGLRISISVANALGYSLNIPIAGASGEGWIKEGLVELSKGRIFTPLVPNYGGGVFTTKPKK